MLRGSREGRAARGLGRGVVLVAVGGAVGVLPRLHLRTGQARARARAGAFRTGNVQARVLMQVQERESEETESKGKNANYGFMIAALTCATRRRNRRM